VTDPHLPIGFATTDDIPELARLRWQLYVEQDGESAESPDTYRERFARFAGSALASDTWRSWVARDGDRLAAAMWLHTVPRVPVPGKRAGPIGYLTNVYVEPAHRNARLGAEMLDQVTAWCRTEGFSAVIVWPTERSRSFYRRGGFARPEEPLVLDVEPDTPLER
jgi:GNAT superfamily N-acetyltransferase